jgi:hypothetical protein
MVGQAGYSRPGDNIPPLLAVAQRALDPLVATALSTLPLTAHPTDALRTAVSLRCANDPAKQRQLPRFRPGLGLPASPGSPPPTASSARSPCTTDRTNAI